jgi:hypothetical protein
MKPRITYLIDLIILDRKLSKNYTTDFEAVLYEKSVNNCVLMIIPFG